jgi:SAM-dependent methyltransferase
VSGGPRLQDGYTPQPLVKRTRDAVDRRGLRPVAGELARWATRVAAGLPFTVTGHHGRFELQGRRYQYLFHRYKRSWLSERAVEVPVVQALVDGAAGRRVLEVGHVLGHFRAQSHTVADKYEPATGVLNRDVLDLAELGTFDLIVAISTLEHVGWDEAPREPEKAIDAVAALRRQLAPGGRLVITVPVGYNPVFDAALRDGRIPLTSAAALRRFPGSSEWREVAPDEVWAAPYDFLLYSARGVLFAFIEAESRDRAPAPNGA